MSELAAKCQTSSIRQPSSTTAAMNAVPAIPAIGLVLVLSIDWFIGMARALGNLIGNCVATVVIAAWEKDLNVPLAQRVLAGDVTVDLTNDAMPALQPAE